VFKRNYIYITGPKGYSLTNDNHSGKKKEKVTPDLQSYF